MGFLDVLMGRRKLAQPAPDRLFAISTAYVTMETSLGLTSRGAAAIVFQPLSTADFESIVRDMEEVVRATAGDSGTSVSTHDDSYGYRWMILRNPEGAPSVEDLAVGINAVSGSIETAGHGERLLCAVFAFVHRPDAAAGGPTGPGAAAGERIYFIYNYKRGFWYPFVPAPGEQQRATERELQIKAQLASELPMEPELERWFPLWGIPI